MGESGNPFDPARMAVGWAGLKSRPIPRHGPLDTFLKGPIPWPWLATAARLPGKVLQVSLVLWKLAGCRNNRTVPFRLAHGAEVGVPRKSARQALRRLEAACLVVVCRRPGRALEVTLLDAPADQGQC